MSKQTAPFYGMNRGEVSRLALARVDIERLRLSAEIQINWLPRVLGPAMLRPGLGFVTEARASLPCRGMPFIFGATDTALMEFSDKSLRVLVNEAPIYRAGVGTVVPDLSTWVAAPAVGATIYHASYIEIFGNSAGVSSTVTGTLSIAGADQVRQHSLRVVVDAGPVTFRVGTYTGLDDVFKTSSLDNGTYSFAFTPGNGYSQLFVQFESSALASRRVSSVTMEPMGEMVLPTPYAYSDLDNLTYETSGDVMYLAGASKQQINVRRYGVYSYGVGLFRSNDGPFPAVAGDSSILITPSALAGNITMFSNRAVFRKEHVGSLIRLFHTGQNSVRLLEASDTYSDVIRVSGVSKVTAAGSSTTTATGDRNFTVNISGYASGAITLQRSLESATAGFTDYASYSANTNVLISDNLDNIVAWYRLGIKSGAFSAPVTVSLAYAGGGGAGVARITSYEANNFVHAEVLTPFTNTTSTANWRFQEWSDAAGWPSAVTIFEGRVWFAGQTKIWGSVSDNYTSFNLDTVGDSGPISRTIGRGPVQNINWLLPLFRLMIGGDSSIITARSNSFDEPLTPTVFTLKDSLTVAASRLPAVKIDQGGIFVSRSGKKAFDVGFDVQKSDFGHVDLTRLNPDIAAAGFTDVAVQREPDTRIHFIRSDGVAAVLLYDKADQAEAWFRIQTDGFIERCVVLPGPVEDRVFYLVRRTINGVTKRYWEKFATIDEAQGAAVTKTSDCHFVFNSAVAQSTISGLGYLEGKSVVVWADGKEVGLNHTNPGDPATYTITNGILTLPIAVNQAVIGLPYTATFKSAKLAYAAQQGTALNQVKRVDHVGMILSNTHALGVKFGVDFDHMDDLPRVEEGAIVPVDTIYETYDQQQFEVNGVYDTDTRLCLLAQSPRPCTVMGFTIQLDTRG